MDALGFRYITNICWVKDRFGLGQYFRGQHELLLFGVKGRLLSRTKSQTTVIQEKRRRHSQKPAATYSKIEAVSPPPYLELFAREPREGWSAWGNEVEPTLQAVLKI
jgi:N6-adenosine-specific RNA methylase IME4